jgi:hypothetical protein
MSTRFRSGGTIFKESLKYFLARKNHIRAKTLALMMSVSDLEYDENDGVYKESILYTQFIDDPIDNLTFTNFNKGPLSDAWQYTIIPQPDWTSFFIPPQA